MKNLVNRIEQLEEEIVKKEKDFSEKFFITEMKKIGIEKLPYAKTALKKFIDPETMDFHYNKHYKGYVEKLNIELDKEKYGDLDLEQIVKTISKYDDTIRNNAGGAYNHALFWKMLSPTPQKPKELVSQRINKDFNTFNKFKKEFETIAKERFGSGWVWLVVTKSNKLKIMSTPNQDNPLMDDVKDGGYPILGLDLWEHAYYLKYRNRRDDYIKQFWEAVNWEFVEKLYKMKLETKINEETVMTQLMLKENEILLEATGHSHTCSTEEEKIFKSLLFPSYTEDKTKRELLKKFKEEYVKGWNSFLKGLYPQNWREKDELFVGHMPGLYDAENKRSLLNNLTSSYSAFCVIHNDINRHLKYTNQEPIVYGDNPEENLSQLIRFFSVMEGIKSRLFDRQSSNTLKHIEKILRTTDCYGKRNEDGAKKIIDENLGDGACTITSGGGLTSDMMSGIDATINIESKILTGQIKPYTNEIEIDNYFIISGSSGAKEYTKVDLLIFVNIKKKKVRIFKTENVTVKKTDFKIPKQNNFMTLQGSNNIKFMNCS
jgi:Fe-Mn family superoxide dismutase